MSSKESSAKPSSPAGSTFKTSTGTILNPPSLSELVSLWQERMTQLQEEGRTPPSEAQQPPSDKITTPSLESKPSENHGFGEEHGFSARPGVTGVLPVSQEQRQKRLGPQAQSQEASPRRRPFMARSPTDLTSTAVSRGAYARTTAYSSRSRRSRSR